MIAVAWLTLAPVAMILCVFAVFPRESLDPGMVLGLVEVAASPPIMSGPAVAMMLNIEPTVLIAATIITTSAAPSSPRRWRRWCWARRPRLTAPC